MKESIRLIGGLLGTNHEHVKRVTWLNTHSCNGGTQITRLLVFRQIMQNRNISQPYQFRET